MKKALFIDETRTPELVTYTKVSEYINGTKSRLCESLYIYSTDDSEDEIIINETEYGLPVLIVPKAKMNNYDLEALLAIFENIEEASEITVDDDDFFIEEDEDEEEYKEDDWY